MRSQYIKIMSTILVYSGVFSFDLQAQIHMDSTAVENKLDTLRKKDVFDVIEGLFDIKKPETMDTTVRKFNFSVLPFTTEVPGGGNILVTSLSASFYLGNRKNTNQSEVWLEPYIDFENRYGISVRSYIWLKQNTWALRGDMRIYNYPEYTWGLGKSNSYENKLLVDRSYLRIYQHFLRRVSPGLLVGLGYNLDVHSNVHTDSSDKTLTEYTNYRYGTENYVRSISSGINFNLLYDTRGNSINPSKGDYINLEYRNNFKFLGSDRWWHSLYFDVRKYYRLHNSSKNQNLIALWSYFWTTFNSSPPYFDLPSIGWDSFNSSGRGFQQGRFRSKSLFYSEAEYRRDITRDGLLGFVLFVNVNSLNGPKSKLFSNWNIGAGGGLRIKVDRESGTNISLDYAVSRDYCGPYFTLGEYF